MFIKELLTALAAAKVPHCIVGGVAMNLHGVPRMTYDVDIVVVPEHTALEATRVALTSLGLKSRIPLRLEELADAAKRTELRDERNLVAVTFTDPGDPLREVDVLVSPPVDAGELVARSIRLSLDALDVPVVSIQDLIEMKRASGRAQDAADIAHLERILEQEQTDDGT